MSVENEKNVGTATGAEKRTSRRKSTRIPGQIVQGRGTQPVACTIRDTSATGAMLELWQGTQKAFTKVEHIGDRFTLVMPQDFLEVDCLVAWRRGGTIGVRYQSAIRIRPRPAKQKSAGPQDNSLLGRFLGTGKGTLGRVARR